MHDMDWSPRPAHKETDKSTSMDIVHALLHRKANVNSQLNRAGADPKLMGKDNQTARLVAAGASYNGHIGGAEAEALEAVKLVVSLGLDVKLPPRRAKRRCALANNLLSRARQQADKRGCTPLDIATGKGGYNSAPGPLRDAIATLIRTAAGDPGEAIKSINGDVGKARPKFPSGIASNRAGSFENR